MEIPKAFSQNHEKFQSISIKDFYMNVNSDISKSVQVMASEFCDKKPPLKPTWTKFADAFPYQIELTLNVWGPS